MSRHRDWTGTNPGYALDSTEPPKPPPPGPAAGTRIHAEDAPNPPDCVCRYKHCSDPQCRSTTPSQGAISERDRTFPVVARHRCDEDCWTYCSADRDGDCYSAKCPQIRDGEPLRSGRHCPLDRCFSERANEVRA